MAAVAVHAAAEVASATQAAESLTAELLTARLSAAVELCLAVESFLAAVVVLATKLFKVAFTFHVKFSNRFLTRYL